MAVCCEWGEEQAEWWWWGSTTTTDKQTSEQTDEHTHMHPFHLQRHRGIFTRTNRSTDGSTRANICKYDWRECGLVSLGKLAAWFGAGAAICRLCSNSRPVKTPSSACHPRKNRISSDSLSSYLNCGNFGMIPWKIHYSFTWNCFILSQRALYFHYSHIFFTYFFIWLTFQEQWVKFTTGGINLFNPTENMCCVYVHSCIAHLRRAAEIWTELTRDRLAPRR